MPPDALTAVESAGESPLAAARLTLVALVGEKKLQELVGKLDAFLSQDVPEGEFREPDAALQWEMDELGRLARDTFVQNRKRVVRLGHRQGPNRRPARRESRRSRNIRTRRAKARAPSGDPSPEPEPPLDLVDIAVLVLGWGRV